LGCPTEPGPSIDRGWNRLESDGNGSQFASSRLHWEDYEPDFDDFEEERRPRDAMVDTAKEALRDLFKRERKEVFYKRQLQVIFEDRFFHWITDRALKELAAKGHIAQDTEEEIPVIKHITFYRANSHRFWRRQAAEIVALVKRFSDPEFTYALGAHGEQMFDAALPRFGFMPRGAKVRSYGGKSWVKTLTACSRGTVSHTGLKSRTR
jgi:hypothetical protein